MNEPNQAPLERWAKMKKRVIASLVILTCLFSAWLCVVTPSQRDDRAKENQGVFETIKKDTKWNMNADMLYGYFFINKRETPLRALGFILSLVGHRVVDISEDERSEYWLHVEKLQSHDLHTISTKEVRLKRIGSIFFSEYDGWDVGPPSSQKK